MKQTLFSLALLASLQTLAATQIPEATRKGIAADFAVGLKAGNRLTRRGATLYDGLWLSPILYVGLLSRRIQFFGNSLEYVDFIWERRLRGRSRIGFVSDRPSIKTGEPFGFRNSRQKTMEWTNSFEFFFPHFDEQQIEVDLLLAKDLKAHGGVHVEVTGRVTLGRWWFDGNQPRLQPQLFATLGWGSGRHNEYMYGLGATDAGLDYFSAGVLLTSPARIDTAYPVLEVAYSRVLGNRNQAGSLVSDAVDSISLTLTAAVGLFSF